MRLVKMLEVDDTAADAADDDEDAAGDDDEDADEDSGGDGAWGELLP